MTRTAYICPSCVRQTHRKHACHRCGYTADTGLPTIEDIRTGRDIGATWSDVDIGAIVRLALRLNGVTT